jgi:NitT/TauT family transport system substrate-binding protein
MKVRVTGLAAVAVVLLCAMGAAQAGKTAVRFRLDYFPKAIHALFYTAQAKGFYGQQNLDVTIVPGDGSANTIKLVGSGEYDFGFADGPTGILGRSRGIPVVAIGAVQQRSPLGIASLKSTGIARPKDLEGKTVGIQPQGSPYVFWLAFTTMNKIDRSKVREINIPGETPIFIVVKRVDAAASLYDNELVTIESKVGAGNASFLLGEDYGFKAYGQSLFTNEKTLNERPDVVRRFLTATRNGMQYAIQNQKEAIDILTKQFRDLDRATMARQLANGADKLFTSPQTKAHGLLWMERDRWDLAHRILVDHMVAAQPIDISKFYTTRFLN